MLLYIPQKKKGLNMNINATTPYSQNFQARIKINKSNLTNIAAAAGLGTTAAASLALQTDFDYGMSQQIAMNSKHNEVSELAYSQNKPEWAGSSFDWSVYASNNDRGNNTEPGSPERTVGLVGALGSYTLTSQLSGYSGNKSLSSSIDNLKDLETTDNDKKIPS